MNRGRSKKFLTRVRNYKEQPNRDEECNTAMKNPLEGIKSTLNDAEEQISELEDRGVEITEAEHKKRMRRNENRLRDL